MSGLLYGEYQASLCNSPVQGEDTLVRASRIVNRWNLKSRAKAGRYLMHWQQRLTEGARNLYIAGQQDALLAQANRSESDVLEAASKERHEQPSLSPPPPPENAHSNGITQGVDRSISGGSLIISGEHL